MANLAYRAIIVAALITAFISGAALSSAAELIREEARAEGAGRALISIPMTSLHEINIKDL